MHTGGVLPGFWTDTTSTTSFAPNQLAFPDSTLSGTQETTDSVGSTVVTGTSHNPYTGDTPMPPASSTSQQVVVLTVGDLESVTVPAGTFQALKLVLVITVTDEGVTSDTTVNEWFTPGVGLVKMDSPYLKRDLTGYALGAATPLLTVALQGGGGGSINSDPAGFSCSAGSCTHPYPAGSSLSLSSLPDGDSLFSGWGGDCTGGLCSLGTGADHSVTATFSAVARAKIGSTGYSSLQNACNALSANATISTRARTFSEDLTIGNPGGFASTAAMT